MSVSSTRIRQNGLASLPEAGALCSNSARRDLCGGAGEIPAPTATLNGRLFDMSGWATTQQACLIAGRTLFVCRSKNFRELFQHYLPLILK